MSIMSDDPSHISQGRKWQTVRKIMADTAELSIDKV